MPGVLQVKKEGLFSRILKFYQTRLSGISFLTPAVILFATFAWLPILWSVVISFQHFSINPNEKSTWAGFQNYKDLFEDPTFMTAWGNVLLFVGLALVIGYFIPVILAILINEIRHAKGVLRLGYYLPAILPVVVISLIWKFLYHPGEGGMFNTLLRPFGIGPVKWFFTDHMAIFSIVIMATWRGAGATMIIYLAALQGIPPELYEAAEIDGASIGRRLWHITLPHILPIMSILLILQVIGTFKVFAEPFIMTRGKTMTIMSFIYEKAFHSLNMGVATAMSMMLFVTLVLLSFAYFYLQRKVLSRF
ncbi:MAG: sugar ABC transporter permease [Candidatus Sumerlaeota bacterium]|nr:sugar ABC transporter permease [Candidatus Sumerlaeota bacterium]